MFNRRQVLLAASAIPFSSLHTCCATDGVGNDALHWLPLHTLRDRIAKRETTSVAVTELMLERIKSLKDLHAYIHVDEAGALVAAKNADESIKKGRVLGPMHGVPVAVKDLLHAEGMPTTAGSLPLANYRPTVSSTVVERLKNAGAVLIGKLTTCEGAMIGYNPAFPVPSNPWDPDVWAGASSSGAGIATAAGIAYGTIGTDGGGSIRTPAAACGVVGLKPSWGRVSRFGLIHGCPSLDHVGPITRSVRDCALMLDVISGPDPEDKTSSLSQTHLFGNLRSDIQGMKVGWSDRFTTEGINPELSEALSRTRSQFESLGAKIIEVDVPDFTPFGRDWVTICSAESLMAFSKWYPARKDEIGPGFRRWLERGEKVTTAEYADATLRRRECITLVNSMLSKVDAFLSPAMDGPPFAIKRSDAYGEYPNWVYERVPAPHTIIHNFNGSPTLTLPCGKTEGNLPLALQLVGKVGGEAEICRLGNAFERSTKFHTFHPPVG